MVIQHLSVQDRVPNLLSSNQACLLTKSNHKCKPKIKTQIEIACQTITNLHQLCIGVQIPCNSEGPKWKWWSKPPHRVCDPDSMKMFIKSLIYLVLLPWHLPHPQVWATVLLSDVWWGKEFEKCLWRRLRGTLKFA